MIGNPPSLSWRPRQSTIKRHSALRDDEGTPGGDPLVEALVQSGASIRENAFPHCDTSLAQLRDAFAGVPRVYVNRADNKVSNAGPEYRLCTWSSAARR